LSPGTGNSLEVEPRVLANESAFYDNDHNSDGYNMSIENEDTAAKGL
jgi:hypothetical protein